MRGSPFCAVCGHDACEPYRMVDGVQFISCRQCGTLIAEPGFIKRVDAGEVTNYDGTYWTAEANAAEQRSFGASLIRVAEVFRMCRIPMAASSTLVPAPAPCWIPWTVCCPNFATHSTASNASRRNRASKAAIRTTASAPSDRWPRALTPASASRSSST